MGISEPVFSLLHRADVQHPLNSYVLYYRIYSISSCHLQEAVLGAFHGLQSMVWLDVCGHGRKRIGNVGQGNLEKQHLDRPWRWATKCKDVLHVVDPVVLAWDNSHKVREDDVLCRQEAAWFPDTPSVPDGLMCKMNVVA